MAVARAVAGRVETHYYALWVHRFELDGGYHLLM